MVMTTFRTVLAVAAAAVIIQFSGLAKHVGSMKLFSVSSLSSRVTGGGHGWPYPAEGDLINLSHGSLLKELSMIIFAMEGVLKRYDDEDIDGKVSIIKELWLEHFVPDLSNNLKYKEVNVYPRLKERLEAFPLQNMKKGNKSITSSMNGITTKVKTLESRKDNLKKLVKLLTKFHEQVKSHFDQEFLAIIPKVRENYNPDEWGKLMRKMGSSNGVNNGCVVDFMGGAQKYKDSFMKPRRIPGFVFGLIIKGECTRYKMNVLDKVDSLIL